MDVMSLCLFLFGSFPVTLFVKERLKDNCDYLGPTTVVLEKTLESPLDCKEIQPIYSEGDQPWVFFGRNDTKAETPVLWPPHEKSWLIEKDSDDGREQGQEEKGTTEDEMAGWHHRLNGCESEWTPGVGDGQGGLACCDSWGRKESDTTERLNWLTDRFMYDKIYTEPTHRNPYYQIDPITFTYGNSAYRLCTHMKISILRWYSHYKSIFIYSLY